MEILYDYLLVNEDIEVDDDKLYMIRRKIERYLWNFSEWRKAFAIYRFGLRGEKVHSRMDTSKYFGISVQEVRLLEATVLTDIRIIPNKGTCIVHCGKRGLKDYLE